MKKFLIVLLVIALVLALAAAGGAGFIWYKNNHIFVEGKAYSIKAVTLDLREEDISLYHYDQVHAQLPDCEILWNVPFQNGRFPSNSAELTIKKLSPPDLALLDYFPDLKKINAPESVDYELLAQLRERRPEIQVVYQVRLGGVSVNPDVAEVELQPEDYDLETLRENMQYLTELKTLVFRKSQLTQEQVEELRSAYEGVEISCTVELKGTEYDTETVELNLAGLTDADVAGVAEKLAMLPKLETVELMSEDGTCELSKENVKQLQQAAPQAVFNYSFEFYGEIISTAAEEVYISKKKIGDEGIDEVRLALDLMGNNCKRFVLENCDISYELLAQVREEYREKTNVVWRVYFGKEGSCLTDREVIKAVYGLVDDNSKDLIYCEGAKFIDFGHNEYLDSCDFVSGMPNLEAIILSGSPIKSLEPFRNCKKLKFLEIAFCGYINDVSPLADCESLEMLNISGTKVADLTPLDELPMTLMCAKNIKANAEQVANFEEKHPECWSQFQRSDPDKMQPYGPGWRYTENGKEKLPYYAMLAEVFEYAKGVEKGINYTRW